MNISSKEKENAAIVYKTTMRMIESLKAEIELLALESTNILNIYNKILELLNDRELEDDLVRKWTERATRYLHLQSATTQILSVKQNQILSYYNSLKDYLKRSGLEIPESNETEIEDFLINLKENLFIDYCQ